MNFKITKNEKSINKPEKMKLLDELNLEENPITKLLLIKEQSRTSSGEFLIKKILIYFKEKNIMINGNLFLNGEYKLCLYIFDIFRKNISIKNFYEMDISKYSNDKRISPKEMNINIDLFNKALNEVINNEKYYMESNTKEWKDFIEPYEYYSELKKNLVQKQFEKIENFDEDVVEILKVNSFDEKYEKIRDKFSNAIFIEDNKQTLIFPELNSVKNEFGKDFLEANKYFISKKHFEFNKKDKELVENKISNLNKKYSILSSGKFHIISSSKNYSFEEFYKKIRSINNQDVSLDVEHLFATDLKSKNEKISYSFYKLININNKINKISWDFHKKNDLNLLKDNFIKTLSLKKELKKELLSYINHFKKFNDDIDENHLIKYKLLLKEVTEFMKDSLFTDDFSKYINKLDLIASNLQEVEANSENNKTFKNIQKEILESNNFFWEEIISYKNELDLKLESLISRMRNDEIEIIKYFFDINLIFRLKDQKKKFEKNVYIINIGDMILSETIEKIIKRIKREDISNNDILYKIIGRSDFNEFKDNEEIIEGNKYVPNSYEKLNDKQKKAFRLAIDTSDVLSIIQGPPGTGKTEVISNLIKYFRNKGEKVLVSSQTNVAIKNVLDKLCSDVNPENSIITCWLTNKENEKFSKNKVSKTWYEKIKKNIEISDFKFIKQWKLGVEEMDLISDEDILSSITFDEHIKAYAASTTTSASNGNYGDICDELKDVKVLIIDEVSKSILPEILRYSLDVEKVILVGDHKQLNPIFDIDKNNFDEEEIDLIKFDKLKKIINSGIFFDLSKRASKKGRLITLNENYRSLPGVLETYNTFYEEEGWLSAHRKIEEFKINYKFINSKYFDINKTFYFFNILNSKEESKGTSRINEYEITAIIDSLKELSNSLENSKEKSVAIIFPYSAQIDLFNKEMLKPLNKELRSNFKSLIWDTIDSFQGSEANIVLLSTVVTDLNKKNFLTEFRRINVALSRAQDILMIFGSISILKNLEIGGVGMEKDKYFNKILNSKENTYLKIIDWKYERSK